ncbi:conjugative transposon protein TraN [Pedobacter sp.]|uniref:conjugative transposon protein TraN n=1 Tax=Pedobacter sp. TaxID=1411316 RepID=UPI00396C6759
MKRERNVGMMIVGIFIFMFNTVIAFGQSRSLIKATEIPPYRIEVSYNKTSNIIFPFAIISVDRGSKDVLAQKAKGAENILQVKAAKESIAETNLSVVTADGKLTSFIVNYVKEPAVLNISLLNPYKSNSIFLSPEALNEAEVKRYADYALYARERSTGMKDFKNSIGFELTGIFIHDDIMYLRVKLQNRSNISYDIDQIRFLIRDQKKSMRTASQEVEIMPVYVHNEVQKINAETIEIMVIAVPKFTIPDKKYLTIQLMEKNGGRHMEIQLKNKKIVSAWPLK